MIKVGFKGDLENWTHHHQLKILILDWIWLLRKIKSKMLSGMNLPALQGLSERMLKVKCEQLDLHSTKIDFLGHFWNRFYGTF